eukprot:gb/GECG01012347.1/.p1 GENE.gb/GECG01012347.1/~~gb/GECG01012347.1/.p1  ORF type:complete len:120 (+),score=11.41 gb/GECG01012347.1/:1-360(+)
MVLRALHDKDVAMPLYAIAGKGWNREERQSLSKFVRTIFMIWARIVCLLTLARSDTDSIVAVEDTQGWQVVPSAGSAEDMEEHSYQRPLHSDCFARHGKSLALEPHLFQGCDTQTSPGF